MSMSVFSIWESRFPPQDAAEGRDITEAIWRDMPHFDGYLRHVIVKDLDDPGHLLVISEWESRAAADKVRDHQYANHQNARRADASYQSRGGESSDRPDGIGTRSPGSGTEPPIVVPLSVERSMEVDDLAGRHTWPPLR